MEQEGPTANCILSPYGDTFYPSSLGTSANTFDSAKRGGGAIHLISSSFIIIHGFIDMDGEACSSQGCSAGSGGSILIKANSFTGTITGIIRANGGEGSSASTDDYEVYLLRIIPTLFIFSFNLSLFYNSFIR